jgi:hypothetical protein
LSKDINDCGQLRITKNRLREQAKELNELKKHKNQLLESFSSGISKLINNLNTYCDKLDSDIKIFEEENILRENFRLLDNLMRIAPHSTSELVRIVMVDQLYEPINNNLNLISSKNIDFCNLMQKLSKSLGPQVKEYLVVNRELVDLLEDIFKNDKGKCNSLVTFDHFLFTRCGHLIKTLRQFEWSKDPSRSLKKLMPAVCILFKKIAASNDNSSEYSAECRKSFIIPLINEYLINENKKEVSSVPIEILNMLSKFLNENIENDKLDDSIYNTLLITFYSQKTQQLKPFLKERLLKNLTIYLNENLTTKWSLLKSSDPKMSISLFEFCVKFLHIMTALNSAIINLDDRTAVSSQLMIVILENVLVNKSWLKSINYQTRPNFASFLSWFYAAFRVFERENSLEQVPVNQLNFDEMLVFSKLEIEGEFSANYNEIVKEFTKQVTFRYVCQLIQSLSKEHSKNNKIMEIYTLFQEFFADNDNICNQLLDICALKQTDMIDKINKVISEALQKFQIKNIDQIKLKLNKFPKEQMQTLISKLKEYEVNEALINKNAFRTVNNVRLLVALNTRLDIDQSISIKYEQLIKVLECLVCFEDISIAVNVLANEEQQNWLTNLIIEHICEKYCLIYLEKFTIECQNDDDLKLVRIKLANINERVLFVFNNLLTNEYVDVMHNRSKSTSDSSPKTNKENNNLKKDKFNIIIELMQNIVFTKELLDQLSSASSLNVWDTILNEIVFNNYFNKKINELNLSANDDYIEKILLFLNRIRCQQGNSNEFDKFINTIFAKLANESNKLSLIKLLEELIEAIHCQFLTFEQAAHIVISHPIAMWKSEINKIKTTLFSNKGKQERTARELIDAMKLTNKRSAYCLSDQVLEKVAITATSFKSTALKMCEKALEDSKVAELADEIYNNKEYQSSPEKYVRANLDQVVPLLLYAWNVANRGQFPKDTQIVALMLFIEQGGLLEQIKTGEGKIFFII